MSVANPCTAGSAFCGPMYQALGDVPGSAFSCVIALSRARGSNDSTTGRRQTTRRPEWRNLNDNINRYPWLTKPARYMSGSHTLSLHRSEASLAAGINIFLFLGSL